MPKRTRLTTAEAAEIVGVTERRIRQLAEFLHADRDEFGRLHFDPAVIATYAESRHSRLDSEHRTRTNAERITALEARLEALEAALGPALPTLRRLQ